ncbi:c-type cytochrome [Belnapia sp. T6]|uniref:C-type cytochrome n=1 Tax=Belnapia mucosa TaxID=2804532 RepID=A0ABS1V0P1_9PROT|nr:c-type cytochrome [Belnapia mucosa]MBL6455275.1 c-type cytochrome [Belnapia mucosa]
MATETETRRAPGGGAGKDGVRPADRPEQERWRLHRMLAELRDDAGDLAEHLLLHWRLILGLVVAAGFGALAFAWSGLYSVAATAGHYPLFRYFLAYGLRQSVETHTISISVPSNLEDPALLRRGAGHYQGGCSPCHGAPGQARNPITRRMLPEPPYLAPRIADWGPAQLFWIVKHGIKYAGMPAWVAPAREDEVWAVVAFLQRLPELDVPGYRQLAHGETAEATTGAGEGLDLLLLNGPVGNGIAACARCHGAAGAGDPTGAFPRLQGQTEDYLFAALQAYALGTRPSGIMQPVAAELNEAEMRLLARHYAGQGGPALAAPEPASGASLALGRRIALEGLPERGIAACAGCHSPKPEGVHPYYPRLSGQVPGYIAGQLELWMRGVRGGKHEAPTARIMAHAIGIDPDRPPAREDLWPLRRQEIEAVAAWYAADPPTGPAPALAER